VSGSWLKAKKNEDQRHPMGNVAWEGLNLYFYENWGKSDARQKTRQQ